MSLISTKPRVVYWFKQPTPYMVERFNAVADRGTLDFEAWFDQIRESDRSWDVNETEWRFPARYLNDREQPRLRPPVRELREARPDVLVQECDRPYLALGFLAGRVLAKRTAFRALPSFDAWSDRTWWREASKRFLFSAVDAAKVPGEDGAAQAVGYGLARERVHFVTQSVDVMHYAQARALDPAERTAERARLGLTGCVFIYVGRIWAGKGLDYLFEAYRTLSATQPNVSLLLVGDGVDEARYRQMAETLPGVRFAGFIQKSDLPHYYGLADVCVFPTLGDPNGLVVEEAMAAGLPVICSEAAGDIHRRLPDGRAGYVVPTAESQVLAQRMIALANDPALRQQFAAEAVRLVTGQTPERYALDFERFIERVLAQPARQTPAAWLAHAMGRGLILANSLSRVNTPGIDHQQSQANS